MNLVVQLLIFIFVACVPCWKYGRMWFVDLAWPFGLVFLGIGTIYYGDSSTYRKLMIGFCYLLQGGRMVKIGYKTFL